MMKEKIRKILFWIFMISSIVLGCYIGVWVMFIKPIMNCCIAFDAGMLTGNMIGLTILSCVFSGGVGTGVMYMIWILYAIIESVFFEK